MLYIKKDHTNRGVDMDKKQEKINMLLRKIKHERSVEAIEQLYNIINKSIRHIGLKYLHNEAFTDDMIQDFWADIYNISDRFTFWGSGEAYLSKIAKNRALNLYKKIHGRESKIIFVDYAEIADPDSNNINLVICVNEAIKKLNKTEQIIIQSIYFENKTIREIAIEMKMSKSTVQRHKDEAIKKLKKELLGKEEITK